MARNTVHCKLCSKAFFPGSLAIHVKQCEKKMALVPVPCMYCREEWPHGDMASHYGRCKEYKKAQREMNSAPRGGSGGGGGLAPTTTKPAISTQGTGRSIGSSGLPPRGGLAIAGSGGDGGGSLVPGARVEFAGLVAKPELNGQTGTVHGALDAASGRCAVRLDDGRGPFNFRPENLRLVGFGGGGGVGTGGGGKDVNEGQPGPAAAQLPAPPAMGDLMRCAICGRGFAMDRVAVHQVGRVRDRNFYHQKSRRPLFSPAPLAARQLGGCVEGWGEAGRGPCVTVRRARARAAARTRAHLFFTRSRPLRKAG